ncbi:O-antigen ligase family protein [Mucisphaera calidilacus]|uniref:O-Antigen ligase n=1 Tax=Mucisphaera calidilacus TaxID=2527982 RepID=A0A518BXK5_9BACT|nr:O-antigen ligase family protein [Mucisphaera calidilacus]QDU71684.1 O-Antigen ligase [Mucisphaera calidilacus]
MKQFLLLCILVLATTIASMVSPFWPLLLYYGFAVMRPQALWNWALSGNIRWSLIAAGLLLLSVTIHFSDLFRRIRLTPFLLALLGFSLLLTFSTLTAYDTQRAQIWGTEYAKVLLVAFLAYLIISRLWEIRALALMLLATVGYLAYTFNVQYFFEGYRLDIFHRGYAGFDNNGAGLMMAMGVPIAYAFVMGAGGFNRLWLRVAAAGAGLLMLHATMLSYSRGAMLAACTGLLWLAIRHRPRFQALGGSLATIVLVAVMAGPEIREEFLSSQHYDTDPSAQSRFTTWSAAWAIAMDHPLLGVGIRNSPQFMQNYGTLKPERAVHNQYLQIAADTGLPACGLYLTIAAIAVVNLGKTAKRARRHAEDNHLRPETIDELKKTGFVCIGLQASIITFLVGSVFLSLEVFEYGWLLLTIGGVAPIALNNTLNDARNITVTDTQPQPRTNDQTWTGNLRLRGA